MAKAHLDPRLAQLRAIPHPQRVALLLSSVTALASDMGKELITKSCQIRDSDTPTGAVRSAITHLMRRGAAAMENGKPIIQATAIWLDNSLHNAVPGMASSSELDLIYNLEEFLVQLFGTDEQLGQANPPTNGPSIN